MKKHIIAAILAAASLLLTSCSAKSCSAGLCGFTEETEEGAAVYHALSAEDAKARLDSGETIIVVDVRRQDEYDEGHLPGAILIPNEDIGTETPAELPDLDAVIFVYCRSGRRSKEAVEKLVAMGYTAVYDIGGIIDWPYETVKE